MQLAAQALFFLYTLIVRPIANFIQQILELVILLSQLLLLLCIAFMLNSPDYPAKLESAVLGMPPKNALLIIT
jgi:hypothetical protein